MTPKPKIQYIGQFYVYGSEAQVLQPGASPKHRLVLPEAVRRRMEKVYVDPVAILSIAVSLVLLVSMVMGMLQLKKDWAQYDYMVQRLHAVKAENHQKWDAYRASYDRAEVRAKAESMGMVSRTDVERIPVTVTIPQPEPEATFLSNLKWFLRGLFA